MSRRSFGAAAWSSLPGRGMRTLVTNEVSSLCPGMRGLLKEKFAMVSQPFLHISWKISLPIPNSATLAAKTGFEST
eukprot:4784187-Amphidinium_carterae.1